MKDSKKLLNIELVSFCGGVIAFFLTTLIPYKGFLRLFTAILIGGFSFILTILLVELYLVWILKK